MEKNDLIFIQDQIGYTFKNPDLLTQAFVRRSYAQENGGEDNEVLEFIGDKVLDIAVVRYLAEKYGYLSSDKEDFNREEEYNEFHSDLSEAELTDLKRRLVEKKMLAHRINVLDIADYLIMGNGDVQSNINQECSVKEDLFEAIMGAIALDSEWNFAEIQNAMIYMLDPDTELAEDGDENYVGLIQKWAAKFNPGNVPWFHCEKENYTTSWHYTFKGITKTVPLGDNYTNLKYCCYLKISDDLPAFRAFSISKSEARKEVCKLAYEYLKKNSRLGSIVNEIENPNREDAINQLETLARRGYFSLPAYAFEKSYDRDGNPIWKCRCSIADYDFVSLAEASSKKEAKKSAAFEMLKYVLSML